MLILSSAISFNCHRCRRPAFNVVYGVCLIIIITLNSIRKKERKKRKTYLLGVVVVGGCGG
jgi:hypothetical protein